MVLEGLAVYCNTAFIAVHIPTDMLVQQTRCGCATGAGLLVRHLVSVVAVRQSSCLDVQAVHPYSGSEGDLAPSLAYVVFLKGSLLTCATRTLLHCLNCRPAPLSFTDMFTRSLMQLIVAFGLTVMWTMFLTVRDFMHHQAHSTVRYEG